MEEEQLQAYNSDSGEDNVDIDGISDEIAGAQMGWIQWFCSLEGHEFLVEIDEDFIKDSFNLYGLQTTFPKDKFKTCIKMILSPLAPNEEDLADEQFLELNQEASDLYGLIHCRYILTPRGIAKVYQKYLSSVYGYCPRALCDKQKVLPVGLSDALKTSRFKVFCPRCEEVYLPKFRNINIDGAYFGTSFPHVFLKHYPEAVILPPKVYLYEPKIFGFNVHGKRGSKYFQPPQGTIKYVENSMTGVDKEKLQKELIKESNKENKNQQAKPQESARGRTRQVQEKPQQQLQEQQVKTIDFTQGQDKNKQQEKSQAQEDDSATFITEGAKGGKKKNKNKKNKNKNRA